MVSKFNKVLRPVLLSFSLALAFAQPFLLLLTSVDLLSLLLSCEEMVPRSLHTNNEMGI